MVPRRRRTWRRLLNLGIADPETQLIRAPAAEINQPRLTTDSRALPRAEPPPESPAHKGAGEFARRRGSRWRELSMTAVTGGRDCGGSGFPGRPPSRSPYDYPVPWSVGT